MSSISKAYRQQLVLACLAEQQGPVSAADLAEFAIVRAQQDGHPRSAYARLDGNEVHGILRTLANQHLVVSSDKGVRDSRAGRSSPGWTATAMGKAKARFPDSPEDDGRVPPLAPAQAAHTTGDATLRRQNAGLAAICDLLAEHVARQARDNAEIVSRVRRLVDEYGIASA